MFILAEKTHLNFFCVLTHANICKLKNIIRYTYTKGRKGFIMNLNGNTVLITGGSNGIGLALAERFLTAGSEVIICGRRQEKLAEAKEHFPALHIKCCDVANSEQRIDLFNWVTKEFPNTNVIVNNAGIQQRVDLTDINKDWDYYKQELTINLEAPIHLSMLFTPHLAKQANPYIINVTSGLAFTPPVWVPVYGATKAGLHSFTFSLRLQLEGMGIGVVEVIPPAVNTDLGGVGQHTFGAPVDDFADTVFAGLQDGDIEIGYGYSLDSFRLTREEIEKNAAATWERMKG